MANRIAVLDKGVLQQVGTPQELYNNPDNIFVAGFIGSPAMNFFEVTVTKEGDTLYLESSQFRLPLPVVQAAEIKDYTGKKLTLGIRPEDIHAKEYIPAGISDAAVVSAKVDVTELMGNEMFVYLLHGEQRFLARVDPRVTARPGDEIDVAFNMANLHAFHTETGKAIALIDTTKKTDQAKG
jgi:multiple sugar transport system ATP-binding protein